MADPVSIDITTEADGSVVVDLSTRRKPSRKSSGGFDKNLAEDVLDDQALGVISQELLEGIQADEDSRSAWVANYNEGLKLLGLLLENPSSVAKDSSTIRHPLLGWAIVQFQSITNGEMLPARGPCKIENTSKTLPDDIAEALERDMNYYLKKVATEYYPDTDRALYYCGYGGTIFKKVYRCPIRERVTSEAVFLPDLIISNDVVDIRQAARVTHVIEISKQRVLQMQDIGYWSDIDPGQPIADRKSTVRAELQAAGIKPTVARHEDIPHTMYECHCTIDLGRFDAAEKGQSKGIELPYRVTIDRDSRQIYEVRRNWKEKDEKRQARKRFIKWGLVPGIGYLDQGYLNLLGNHSVTLTALLRVLVDSGIYSIFPGGVRVKGMRMESNQIRPAPGEFPEIDTAGLPINQAIMPLPFKGPTAEALQLLQHIEGASEKMAGTVTIPTNEGIKNIPVGTMMAAIEQESQVTIAVHKRLHNAQGEELSLIRDELCDDEEGFALLKQRDMSQPYTREQLASASLVPASDPNVPAHIHRLMQATALEQLSSAHPELYDQREVQKSILEMGHFNNPDRVLLPPPDPNTPPSDPDMALAQAQLEIMKKELQITEMKAKADASIKAQKMQADAAVAKAKLEQDRQKMEHEGQVKQIKEVSKAQTDAQKASSDTQTEQEWIGLEKDRQARELEIKDNEVMSRIDMEQTEADKDRESEENIQAMHDQTKLIIEEKRLDHEPTSPNPTKDKKSGP